MNLIPVGDLTPQQVKEQINILEKKNGETGNKRTRFRNRGKNKQKKGLK
jgi:hypothetical protein